MVEEEGSRTAVIGNLAWMDDHNILVTDDMRLKIAALEDRGCTTIVAGGARVGLVRLGAFIHVCLVS